MKFMAMEAKCTVAECEKRAHARGYCRRHYEQIHRKGEIRSDEEERRAAEKLAQRLLHKNDRDRARAMERELQRVEFMYRNVIGFEGRLKWRREIDDLKKDMARLGIAIPAPATVEAAF